MKIRFFLVVVLISFIIQILNMSVHIVKIAKCQKCISNSISENSLLLFVN